MTTSASDFPVLDAARDHDTTGRSIIDVFDPIKPRIDETDGRCAMPVRLAHSPCAGFYVEVGPYDLDRADIEVLRRAIAAYDLAAGVRPSK